MTKQFIYTEFTLENSKLIPLQDNGFQIILKLNEKTGQNKFLFVKSTFIDLGDSVFDIEVKSSQYNDGNSQNGNFNLKLPILETDKANPPLLMTKVFNKVQTTNLSNTLSNYSELSSQTFSMKLWQDKSDVNNAKSNTDEYSGSSTTSDGDDADDGYDTDDTN